MAYIVVTVWPHIPRYLYLCVCRSFTKCVMMLHNSICLKLFSLCIWHNNFKYTLIFLSICRIRKYVTNTQAPAWTALHGLTWVCFNRSTSFTPKLFVVRGTAWSQVWNLCIVYWCGKSAWLWWLHLWLLSFQLQGSYLLWPGDPVVRPINNWLEIFKVIGSGCS